MKDAILINQFEYIFKQFSICKIFILIKNIIKIAYMQPLNQGTLTNYSYQLHSTIHKMKIVALN